MPKLLFWKVKITSPMRTILFLLSNSFLTKFYSEDIENYEIIDKLGKGKYSEVFKGIKIDEDKEVAIKILKPSNFWVKK